MIKYKIKPRLEKNDEQNHAFRSNTCFINFRLQAFQNGDGYRYLILKSFDASSLSNTQLTFLYQGLTLDQKFFVSVVAQVDAPFLQEYVNQTLSTPEEFENYFQTVNEQVENADTNSFEPSLNILDEMIASIVIIEK